MELKLVIDEPRASDLDLDELEVFLDGRRRQSRFALRNAILSADSIVLNGVFVKDRYMDGARLGQKDD